MAKTEGRFKKGRSSKWKQNEVVRQQVIQYWEYISGKEEVTTTNMFQIEQYQCWVINP